MGHARVHVNDVLLENRIIFHLCVMMMEEVSAQIPVISLPLFSTNYHFHACQRSGERLP